jgi:hypothetical protein
MAMAYTMLSHRWLNEGRDGLRAPADPVLVEALDIVEHDSAFVTAKLRRALDGRDRHRHGEEHDDDPVQSDWNGSAKVALISLERSEIAWRTIVHATGDEMADALAASVGDLRRLALAEFPRAMCRLAAPDSMSRGADGYTRRRDIRSGRPTTISWHRTLA